MSRILTFTAAAIALAAVLSAPVQAARPGSTPPPPVRASEPAEEAAAPLPQSEGGPGWWQRFRISMTAKNYGLDEATTLELQRILGDEEREKDRLVAENRELINSLEDEENRNDAKISEILGKVAANRVALANNENNAQSRIVALLGTTRAADWFLSKRGMLDRARSGLQRGREAASERSTGASDSGEVRGNPARNR